MQFVYFTQNKALLGYVTHLHLEHTYGATHIKYLTKKKAKSSKVFDLKMFYLLSVIISL